ncbi:MAG: eL32 family ribosomal protein, partial [Promethearchaeota archaeon]
LVHNIKDLQQLNPKVHIATIASSVGKLKKTLMLLEAEELNVLISNPGKLRPTEEKLPIPEIYEEEEEKIEEGEETEEEEIEETDEVVE